MSIIMTPLWRQTSRRMSLFRGMMEKIVLLGGGGHAKVLIDLINACGGYEIAGIVDAGLAVGESVSGIPVLGDDGILDDLHGQGVKNACIAVGSIKDNSRRKMLFEKAREVGFSMPSLIHPSAVVSGNSSVGDGVQVMAGAIIQTDASIGQNTIVNTGAIVEHDCTIGSHAHLCPGVVISGGCAVGEGSFIGAGAMVVQGITIGDNAVVSAGAVVIRDVSSNSTVMGVPAK
jgi:sugar O-acyltransferase (sialic acid O-acetyltransferase NeuD family)